MAYVSDADEYRTADLDGDLCQRYNLNITSSQSRKVQVGNDQENAQSERNFQFKNREAISQ